MIVCSVPRCGATKYCLDLEVTTGLRFVGELNPMYLYENRKTDVHETRHQDTFSVEQFTDILHNKDKYIVLVNKSPYLCVAESDIVVLRRNMLDSFMSFGNFLLKMYPDIDTKVLIKEVQFSIYDYRAVRSYIDRYKKNVVWYEDYFGMSGTSTELLDNHRHGRLIKKAIHNAFENSR